MTKTITLTTDYLIIGAGALGMGFLDELINTSSSLEAIIVDQRDKPGGHWTDAYSFVRLHQPAVTYGVNSRPLGVGGPDHLTPWHEQRRGYGDRVQMMASKVGGRHRRAHKPSAAHSARRILAAWR